MQNQITAAPYNLECYNYHLPPELIAQNPVEPRDHSRLLAVDRRTGGLQDRTFRDIIDYMEAGDTLVVNHTRVIPARLFACKDTGARVEMLLLTRREEGWEALVKPARRIKVGTRLQFAEQPGVEAEVVTELDLAGGRLIRFLHCPDEELFINQVGHMPLPPYINRPAQPRDKELYQTVYASQAGSAAAPTAGLHFTEQLLQEIKGKGVNITAVTLHVGLGTFRPVSSRDIRQHQMHSEYYQVDARTAKLLNETRAKGHSIIAVGTTVVRTLETVYEVEAGYRCQSGLTNKFIYPGYEFQAIDKMITNFHLPGSSLLMLVAALAGMENTQAAYRHAVASHYRFFSYGDAMFII